MKLYLANSNSEDDTVFSFKVRIDSKVYEAFGVVPMLDEGKYVLLTLSGNNVIADGSAEVQLYENMEYVSLEIAIGLRLFVCNEPLFYVGKRLTDLRITHYLTGNTFPLLSMMRLNEDMTMLTFYFRESSGNWTDKTYSTYNLKIELLDGTWVFLSDALNHKLVVTGISRWRLRQPWSIEEYAQGLFTDTRSVRWT